MELVAPGRPVPSPGPVVYVAGGLTPAYQVALCAEPAWLDEVRLFGGFSAGAAIAPGAALVGGWRANGVPVCDDGAGEDLDEVEVRPGLGLLDGAVEVHCAQWGTLGRLVHAVAAQRAHEGWGLDEHTTLEVRDGRPIAVHGTGAAWRVRRGEAGALVTRLVGGPLAG